MFSRIKDIKHMEHDFHSVSWVMPQGWAFEVLGVKNLIFQNMVMWQLKLKGMKSRIGNKQLFHLMVKLVTLG